MLLRLNLSSFGSTEPLMPHLVPLELLAADEEGSIEAIEAEAGVATRLAEMGFRQGARIRMLRPGMPCLVELGHHRLSVRLAEAAVLVAVDGQPGVEAGRVAG